MTPLSRDSLTKLPTELPPSRTFRIEALWDTATEPRVQTGLSAAECEAAVISFTHDLVWNDGRGVCQVLVTVEPHPH